MSELKTVKALAAGIKTLYHYQRYDGAHVVDLLKNKRIFCSNLGNLNDPWDCTVSFKIDDHQSASNPKMLELIMRIAADKLHADNVRWRRIYCLTPHVRSTLMWSHYAENHKGICLEFAVKPDNVFATAFKVLYEQEFMPFELSKGKDGALLPFLVKADCWKYEDEYRLFLRIHDPNAMQHFPECMRVVDNYVPLPEGSLQSIVIGCQASPKIGIKIRQLVDEYWPGIKVKQMYRHPSKYELEVRDFYCGD